MNLDIRVINRLFERLFFMYPAFEQQFKSEEKLDGAKQEWLNALTRAQISNLAAIKCALDECAIAHPKFAPTIGEFIELCRAPMLKDVPDVYTAFNEASRNSHPVADRKWSHPAVYEAWKRTGSFDMRSMSKQQIFPRFSNHYHEVLECVKAGARIELPSPDNLQLTHNKTKSGPTPIGLSALERVKEMLNK